MFTTKSFLSITIDINDQAEATKTRPKLEKTGIILLKKNLFKYSISTFYDIVSWSAD